MSSTIEIIREWIHQETAFTGRSDELFIIIFLEACDNDVEKTKRRIVRYYEVQRLYPRLMRTTDLLYEKHVNIFRQKVMYSDMMKENYELPAVLTIKTSRLEYNDHLSDVTRASIFTIKTGLLESARFRKYGGIAIYDCENMKFTHILQATPNLLRQSFKCILEALPIKFKGIIAINAGSLERAAISVGTLFLPTEVQNIITVRSGSWDSIRDIVPPQCLPIEYGGTNGTLEESLEPIEAMFLRWKDYLLDDERFGFNDTEQDS